MSDFKLIAIRPLADCDKKYTKVLTRGEIYPLYQGYFFFNSRGIKASNKDEVVSYLPPKERRLNIHDVKTADDHPLNINISAVVGKNGTGKSTLMDILFAATYLASMSEGLLRDSPSKLRKELRLLPDQIDKQTQRWQKALDKQEELRGEFNSNQKRKSNRTYDFDGLTDDAAINLQWIISHKKILDEFRDREKTVQLWLDEMRTMAELFQAEIFYQLDRAVYCLRVFQKVNGDPGAELYNLSLFDPDQRAERTRPLDLSAVIKQHRFFYTVAINYSHYALNELYLGHWVNSLFHKNDGYKTPIVINPMRDNGVFDINRELLLGKYRLLSNLLIQRKLTVATKPVPLTDQLDVYHIWLTVDREKVEDRNVWIDLDGLQGKASEKNLIKDIFQIFFKDAEFGARLPAANELVDLVLNYIVQKVKDIRKYDGLGRFKLTEERSAANRTYFEQLRDEPSHVVFKLKQAIHFLKRAADPQWIDLFGLYGETIDGAQQSVFEVSLGDLLKWAENPKGHEMINFLPPAIFKIDIELQNEKEEKSFFQELSSGEQQMINTIQTVLYHLNNLQSVRYSKLPRRHYRAINLVFDEIELYFHPAYQRAFIDELLKALQRVYVGDDRAIETINILFLTHSPFILSDIPKSQITLLSIDENSKETIATEPESETFAANINELLAGSFFLEGTLMGVLAENKVNELIKAARSREGLNEDQGRLLELIGDSYLRNSLKHFMTRRYDQDRAE